VTKFGKTDAELKEEEELQLVHEFLKGQLWNLFLFKRTCDKVRED
jgi:hypothetical protein